VALKGIRNVPYSPKFARSLDKPRKADRFAGRQPLRDDYRNAAEAEAHSDRLGKPKAVLLTDPVDNRTRSLRPWIP